MENEILTQVKRFQAISQYVTSRSSSSFTVQIYFMPFEDLVKIVWWTEGIRGFPMQYVTECKTDDLVSHMTEIVTNLENSVNNELEKNPKAKEMACAVMASVFLHASDFLEKRV